MSILAAVRQKIKERQGKSFALLAERVDKSAVAPYCINTAENVSSEETMVLILGGAGGRGVHLRGYNGYLKKTDDFIKTHRNCPGRMSEFVSPFVTSGVFIMSGWRGKNFIMNIGRKSILWI